MTDSVFVSAAGTRFEARSWPLKGSDAITPILLLHEGLGSVSMWRDFPERLQAACARPVVAWSRAGYGLSDPLPGPRDPDYLHREADLVPAVMDALDLPHAHFFGHSDGASIALIAAARHPERVRSVAIEAPHVYVEDVTVAGLIKIKQNYDGDPGFESRLARHHRTPDQVFRRWNDIWLDPRFRAWNIEDVLPAITQPLLMIQGCDDEYGTADQLHRIAAGVPGAEQMLLEACGHTPHRDHPALIAAAVCEFLRRIDG